MNTELYSALCEAGASPEKATAAASVTPSAERVASKEEAAGFASDVRAIRWHLTAMLALLLLVVGMLFQQQFAIARLESAAQANANSINALKVAVERSASAELSP